jgi:hypothetical protein
VIGGIVVFAVVVAIAVYLWLRRDTEAGNGELATAAVAGMTKRRPEADFHVVRNEAQVIFDVPLPTGGADPVLRDLLLRQATELIRDRKRRGQPLEGIDTLRVYAKRSGETVEVVSRELAELSELPEVAPPLPLARTVAEDHDLLRQLDESDIKGAASAGDPTALDQLEPVGADIRLTAGLEAGLRSIGIDPDTMSVEDLGIGLLELAGYRLQDRGDGSYVASGGGTTSYVAFVPHEAGSYPELETSAINQFLVGFSTARTDRGLLITDKFGPYSVYQKERSNPNCRFITRERLQAFVDSIALG